MSLSSAKSTIHLTMAVTSPFAHQSRTSLGYVIITPAKNEEIFMDGIIQSVLSQTLKPLMWVIVDDGSADRTAELVSSYLPYHQFMRLVKLPISERRGFDAKVAAFNAGLENLGNCQYSFIGNLDADITLPPDYYAKVITEFERDPGLGIAGGTVYTRIGKKFITSDAAVDSVGGAVQLFRKECFEQIGGYLPLPFGGIDAAAEITARMKRWRVSKVLGNQVYEYRRTGSAQAGLLSASFREGMKFHSLGYSAMFYFLRCLHRLSYRPFGIGGILALIGFARARLCSFPVYLSPHVVSYLRMEQAQKLKQKLSDAFGAQYFAQIFKRTKSFL